MADSAVDDILSNRRGEETWGTLRQLAQTIGQTLASIPQRRAQLEAQRAQIEERQALAQDRLAQVQIRQQQAAAAQRAEQMNQTIGVLAKDAFIDGPDGSKVFDIQRLVNGAAQQGVSPQALAPFLTHIEKVNESTAKFAKERRSHIADVLDAVIDNGADDRAITLGAAYGKANGWLRDEDLASVYDAVSKGQDVKPVLMQMRDTLRGPQEAQKNPTEASLAMAAARGDQRAQNALGLLQQQRLATQKEKAPPAVGSFEDYVVRYAQSKGKTPDALTPADVEDARKRFMQADDKATGFAASDTTNLSPAGLDMAALNYRKTGVMPPLGMGDKTTRKKIIDRAAALTKDDIARIEAGGTDVASNKAIFGADADALKALQKQRDAIGAFENTAKKNIDIFLEQAGKVVDTGSPLANTVARVVSGKMLGSPDQAAYDAARQVAINEIAKITSNPTLSGQLSDSARHEVEAFNPNSATLKQSVAVMRLLKRDMENRTGALDEQIKTIKGRMKQGSPNSQPNEKAAPVTGTPSYQDYLKSRGRGGD